ncbi:shufflon system plasmid conjugative transfer pilus tip adhesin PilV [Yersinia similis]|uniref:Shufflon protein n=1 Tax=Yersinia similis TaxID=367190 RepID=A0A0T9R2M1_9GAMM|nr:shufflon system plasmid conjugative transfer pilus tip adhesin PilV [Yersinia similis]CNG52646.1 shufflon protein [Yersinia similis]CNI41578.1 shufflon protein [Yersinia similis]
MTFKTRALHRGWAMMSTGIALLILVIVVIWATSIYGDYIKQKEYQVTAVQLSRFKFALKGYVGRHYDKLLASAGTNQPVMVTTAMLKNTGFLPGGFSDTTTTGQRFQAAIVRNAMRTEQLQALIVTQGGSRLPYKALRIISADIEGLGGYVWNNANVTGAMGSWSVPLNSFGLSTSTGHVAALLTTDELSDARNESDRLYRFAVTGKPDFNRMHTSIDMGGNNLNNTGTVNAIEGRFSGNINAVDVTAEGNIRSQQGWLISRGDKGWLNESYGGGFYMSDNDWVRSVNNKSIATGGQIKGGNIRSDGRLSVGEVLQLEQVNSAGGECSSNGLVSRDASGALLSCQSGVWGTHGKVDVINGNNPTCPANKIPVARYWTQAGGSNYGNYCTLQTGWAGVTMPSCESCVNWEKCHMVYSQTWSATACS